MPGDKTSTTPSHKLTSAAKGPVPALPSLEAHLRRFDPQVRRKVRALVRQSSRVGDLVRVFPAAVHRLAQSELPQQDRTAALNAIDRGVALKNVARLLDLPLWLRKLPPDAFRGDIPALPDSPYFTRQIASRLPRSRRASNLWVDATSFAARAGGDAFAIWVAERPELLTSDLPAKDTLRVLAAYAAISSGGETPGDRLIGARWRPEMSTDSALCGAMTWFNRVRLMTLLKNRKLDPWLSSGEARDHTFTALTTVEELLLEAQLMHNCVDQYASLLCTDRCRLFCAKHDGARVATVEIARHPKEPSVFTITQLKGPSNVPAPLPVWQAAYAWLAEQDRLTRVPSLYNTFPRGQIRVWNELFADYRKRFDGAPWWPATPTTQALSALDGELKLLARNANVISWLFR